MSKLEKAKFISLEGIEGVGKSTNMNYLAEKLTNLNKPFIQTREPGGTQVAETIRQILLQTENEVLLPKTELLLLYAGRYQHVQHVIKPALENQQWVLCDRFFDATLAYQGGGREQSIQDIWELNQWVLGDFKPDYTIILDAPVEVALTRIKTRNSLDRFEKEDVAFFTRIRNQYLALAEQDPKRFWVVDAEQDLPSVHKQLDYIMQKIMEASDE